MSLDGKIALVTGGSRGLGRSITVKLASLGVKVAINFRANETEAANTIQMVKQAGGEVMLIKANVGDSESVNSMVNQITEKWGRVDILVNNAGVTAPDKFSDIPLKRWDLITGVNLNGSAYCAHAVLPQMIARNSGVIINMSSILALRVQYSVVYGATKAAIERFTTGLARELRKTDISVSAMRPYFVKTEAVEGFLEGYSDMSDWEEPEKWGHYTAKISDADPAITRGKIFDQALCKETFGAWK
jgi:NAD(P)-dependent dehydrogenase (short-subunit alcohol dehydrogenase family)